MTTLDLADRLALARATHEDCDTAQCDTRALIAEVERQRSAADQIRVRLSAERDYYADAVAALTSTDAIEAAARTIYNSHGHHGTWDDLYPDHREDYRQQAHDSITAALRASA